MSIPIIEKYERSGWPSLTRPDIKPPDGWSLALITAINRIFNHRLSPDGERIAFLWNREDLNEVFVMPASGGWPRRISVDRAPWPYWWEEVPQWSPDGRWLAFSVNRQVHIVDSQGGIPKILPLPLTKSTTPMWLPDSNRLIITLYNEDDAPHLYLSDRQGTFLRRLTPTSGDNFDARPSWDGRYVAYVHWPADDLGRRDIRLTDLETNEVRLLVGKAGKKDWSPRWSPDSQWIAFQSQRTENDQVWLIRPDGEGLHQLTKLGVDVDEIAWSPDGKLLACTLNRRGSFDLALIEVETGSITELRVGRGIHSEINWAPDGSFLTFEYEDPLNPPDIYRFDIASRKTTQLTYSNPPALEKNPKIMPEEVVYKSYDGLEISALLYKPHKANRAALVFPHGGPTEQYGYCWDELVQYFVAKGYTIILPNYRGSTGYGYTFEHANYNNWGKGDVKDILYAARLLAELPGIDHERIGIYGASYGGYLSICCLSRDPDYLFACGISKFGDANLFTSWAQCERNTRLYTRMQIGHPASNRQSYLDGSPIYQVKKVRRPMLILHGMKDDVVPPQASEELAEAMRRHGKTFEYKTYADEPHGFQKRTNIMEAYVRIERFFDWYLLPHTL